MRFLSVVYDLFQVCPRCESVFRPFSTLTADSRLLSQRLTLPVRSALNHNDGDQVATSMHMATGARTTKQPAEGSQPPLPVEVVGTTGPQRNALPDPDPASLPPLARNINAADSKLVPPGSAASVCRFTWQPNSQEAASQSALFASPPLAPRTSIQQRQAVYDRMLHPVAPVFDQATILSAPLRFYSGSPIRAVPDDAWAAQSFNVSEAVLSTLAPIGPQLLRTYSWPGPSVSGDVTWRAVPAGSACPPGVCVDSDSSDLLVTRPPTQWLFTPDNCVPIRYHKDGIRTCMQKLGITQIGIIGDSLSMNWANDVFTPLMKDLISVDALWEFSWKQEYESNTLDDEQSKERSRCTARTHRMCLSLSLLCGVFSAAPISRGLTNYLHSWGMTDGKWNDLVRVFDNSQLVVMNSGHTRDTHAHARAHRETCKEAHGVHLARCSLVSVVRRSLLHGRVQLAVGVVRSETSSAAIVRRRSVRVPQSTDSQATIEADLASRHFLGAGCQQPCGRGQVCESARESDETDCA